MKKERTIFDTAHWADLQKFRASELERYKKQVADLNKRLNEIKTPLTPEQVVPMEIEETGHEAQASLGQHSPPEIEVKLQPPKGYILFPEPKEEPVYVVDEEENNE